MTDDVKKPAAKIDPKPEPAARPDPVAKPEPVAARAQAKPQARVCHENDRAAMAPGCKRFRVRAIGENPAGGGALKPVGLYVLAPDRDSAEACYLAAEAADLKAAGFHSDKWPHLAVDELVD